MKNRVLLREPKVRELTLTIIRVLFVHHELSCSVDAAGAVMCVRSGFFEVNNKKQELIFFNFFLLFHRTF